MRFLASIFIGFVAGSAAFAQENAPFAPVPAHETTLEAQKWVARPIVIFAERPDDPQALRQLAMIEAEWAAFAARDVIVIFDADPSLETDTRTRMRPHGFRMVLIAKDGTIALRKPTPYTARELLRTIDKMPLRLEEERERRALNPRPMQ